MTRDPEVTEAQVRQMLALAEAAQRGPWRAMPMPDDCQIAIIADDGWPVASSVSDIDRDVINFAFIAAAHPSTVAALAREVLALRAKLARVREYGAGLADDPNRLSQIIAVHLSAILDGEGGVARGS